MTKRQIYAPSDGDFTRSSELGCDSCLSCRSVELRNTGRIMVLECSR
jgi:hypothetical protein